MSKTVLITGAASGIGLYVAQQLAMQGHTIIVTDLNQQAAQQAAAGIVEQGGSAEGYALNVADSDAIEQFFTELNQPIDVLINNAGIDPKVEEGLDWKNKFEHLELDSWNKM